MRRKTTVWLAVCAVSSLSSCEHETGPATAARAREIMGTFATLTAVAADEQTASAAVEAGYGRLEDVNRLMSDYIADSEIGRLNRLPGGESLQLSPETFHCLQRAVEIAEASGGAFDVTCRPLVTLWKKAAAENRLPSDQDLSHARALVGPDKLALNAQSRTVSIVLNGIQVDLGGIAKGYALDLAAKAMLRAGAASVLVDVGGDVLAVGTKRDGKPWRIGVRHPFREGVIAVLKLSDRAAATSGVQQRFYEIDGKRYSHIIDPRTSRPAEQAPSVTVIAGDGLTADAWSTAFSVLSIDEGRKLLETGRAPQIEVMWITGPGDQPIIEKTAGFDKYLVE
ncbi:MAG: FAD:protein FMN transferase [Phycisphaerae bacterium]